MGDRRPDVKVKLSLAKQALVKDALEAASRQGGVELRLSRELENRFLIDRYDGEVTLREFMEYIAGQRQWAPQEDGSYLLRARAKKP